MGREIRRVPPGWQHPVNEYCRHIGRDPHRGLPCYRPLFDNDYESAALEWEAEYAAFMQTPKAESRYAHYWECANPPDEENYRAQRWTPEEATCYQVYETVSEGTPISPVFATVAAMRTWLIGQGHSEYATDQFIVHAWAPSMVIDRGRGMSGIGIDSYDFERGQL